MKKIISLCSVLIVLALVVTLFTACDDKTNDETTTTTPEAVGDVATGYTAELGDASVVIKNNGEVVQTLNYPITDTPDFDMEYAKEHNEFLDMNFDGVLDYYIAHSAKDGVIKFYCWLYNDTAKKFEYSVMLSALTNISIDAENHRVLSTSFLSGEAKIIPYHWVDGRLVKDEEFDVDNDADITNVVEENAIGTDKTTVAEPKPEKTTKKENNKNNNNNNNNTGDKNDAQENQTTTKANKPANTTTTAPNEDSGIILDKGSLNDDGWF